MKRFALIVAVTLTAWLSCTHIVFAQSTAQPVEQKRSSELQPTFANVKYGDHERNVMDVWLAQSDKATDKPTPVLVSIHGGAFRHGDKSVGKGILRECLKAGISVVAITYRFSHHAIAPAQHLDAARAVQFVRHNAKKWNIDPTRVAATGGSAGAGMSLWLGFHDDLADPDNTDPVLRQSTRLTCMAVNNGQSSYDPRFIRKLYPNSDTYKTSALAELFGADLNKLDELPTEKYELFEEISAINHFTKDDPPVLMTYNSSLDTPISSRSIGIHHPRFGRALKEKMDEQGIEFQMVTGIKKRDGNVTKHTVAFIKRHLLDPVIEKDVVYSVADGKELKLDIARPAGEGPFPTILFIHGGGWHLGDRTSYKNGIMWAAQRGYVGATISYRLMKFDTEQKETTTAEPKFPAQIHDAKAAVRWLRANAAKYKIDPQHIGVTGKSAGGHLSLLVGLTDQDSHLEGNGGNLEQSSRVQAVVNVFGPTDMKTSYETSSVAWIFRLFMGGTPDEAPETYRVASPVTYASSDDPPVLTVQGDRDKLVPLAQAQLLDKKLKAAGGSHTLLVLAGQGHGFPYEYRVKQRTAMWNFFDQHLKPPMDISRVSKP